MNPFVRICLVLIAALHPFSRGWCAAEDDALEDPRGDAIYSFQHRLLPQWTFASEGAFFADLVAGELEHLEAAASELVDVSFKEQLKVRALPDGLRVLITFEEPMRPPLCYCVIIEKNGDTFRYLTLEKTEDIFDDGTRAVCGAWTAEGSHQNFGGRNYADEATFIAEVTAPQETPAGAKR